MATFGGIDLGAGGAAVFELTTDSDDEESLLPLPDGSEVFIPANSRFLVVRECPGTTFDEVHSIAHESANRAIDIHFGLGGRPLVLGKKDSTYIVGWIAPAGRTMRIVGRTQLHARFRARGEVRDADGNLIMDPPPPPKVWHQSLRYYRVSESATDLYDSFRNVYLAIESLCSDVVAPELRSNGCPEGDSEWLRRALRVVGQTVDLSPYAPESSKAPHNAIHTELYGNLRTAIFHGKTGRATWAPQDWASRGMIVAARARYARLFRALACEYLDIQYPGGGFAKAFWEDSWEEQLRSHEVFVSNDPTKIEDEPKGEYELAPAGGDFLRLPTSPADDMAADWRRGVCGREVASTIHLELGEIRRFGTLRNSEPALVESLHAPLVVDDLDELQVVLLVEGRNYGQPRQDFES
jgi:hypothetical protein